MQGYAAISDLYGGKTILFLVVWSRKHFVSNIYYPLSSPFRSLTVLADAGTTLSGSWPFPRWIAPRLTEFAGRSWDKSCSMLKANRSEFVFLYNESDIVLGWNVSPKSPQNMGISRHRLWWREQSMRRTRIVMMEHQIRQVVDKVDSSFFRSDWDLL